MLEIVQAGGWLMWPIIACSVIAVAIILERLWTLQEKRVLPVSVANQVSGLMQQDQIDVKQIQEVQQSSPFGQVLAAGLAYRYAPREVLKEAVEDTGRHAVHELERYLSTLGTIAAISPLLGLLGTVSGMIRSFTAITADGVPNPAVLAGGISEALVRAWLRDDLRIAAYLEQRFAAAESPELRAELVTDWILDLRRRTPVVELVKE